MCVYVCAPEYIIDRRRQLQVASSTYQQAVRHSIDIFEPDRWNSVAAVAQTSS
jgi:hypothetical protein